VLRRIFGLKRVEMMGGWRKLHNEELRPFIKYNWNYEIEEVWMGGS
jgi:hypothetical protein